jgi:hypothetical protein
MVSRALRALRSIEIVTHCVPSLEAVLPAYTALLEYRLAERGFLSKDLCAAWATPAMVGLPYLLLQPASGADVYLRFIETTHVGGYWPPVTQGWIATEVLANAPDELKDRLEGSAFKRIGGPADLYAGPKSARAMQMQGPAGELMYFTRILPGGSRFGLHGAKSFVDRPFIMVVGGDSMAALHAFYRDRLGLRVDVTAPFKIRQMSRVLEVDSETEYPISIARIPGRSFLLELEEFPANVERRRCPDGQLPEGLAMVAFTTPAFAGLDLDYRAAPVPVRQQPYAGRRVAVVEGPAGEWLELIECPD